MKKIILAQVLTAKGKTEFSGLYDRHGNAVTVEVERDSSGVSLIVWQDEQKKQHFDCGISEEEKDLRSPFFLQRMRVSTMTAASQRRRYSVPVQCLMTAAIVR